MHIKDSVAFVTGANRGPGLAFVQALLAGGARTVSAARHPSNVQTLGVEAIRLDVTSAADIAAQQSGDVALLIYNAGISDAHGQLRLQAGSAQREFETNVLGRLHLGIRADPVLSRSSSWRRSLSTRG